MPELIVTLRDRELQRLPLTSVETTIGRDLAADLTIDNVGVSRIHATVAFVSNAFVVTDTESSNGITVNGNATNKAVLRDGDIIGINKFLIRFSTAGGVPPEALASRQTTDDGKPRDVVKTINLDADSVAAITEAAKQQIAKQRALKAQASAGAATAPRAAITIPRRESTSPSRPLGMYWFISGVAVGVLLLVAAVALRM